MARLLNDDRRFIKHKLLNRAFDGPKQELKNEGDALHTKICVASFGEHWPAVRKLPIEFFATNLTIQLHQPGSLPNLTLRGHMVHRVTQHFSEWWNVGRDNTVDQAWLPRELHLEVQAWIKRATEMEETYAKAEREITMLLGNVTTYKKLFATWPELKELIPEPPTAAQTGNVIAPYLPALNKVLGLPPGATPAPPPVVKAGVKKKRVATNK